MVPIMVEADISQDEVEVVHLSPCPPVISDGIVTDVPLKGHMVTKPDRGSVMTSGEIVLAAVAGAVVKLTELLGRAPPWMDILLIL